MPARTSLRGIFYGCVAAVCYGTNPLGALNLYKENLTPENVLCYRFGWTVILLGLFIGLVQGKLTGENLGQRFSLTFRELKYLSVLGILFAACALTLYAAFEYMDAGLACTLLFLYPVEVAVIMALFFKERVTFKIMVSIILSLAGIVLLYRGGEGGVTLSTLGVVLVGLSSLTYAVYIVVVNRANLQMKPAKLTFYSMFFCFMAMMLYSASIGCGLPPIPSTLSQWGWSLMLGFVPTVLSLVFMTKAVNMVGATPTAITGALEPLTAVIIGVSIFGEVLTGSIVLGIFLILASVILLALKNSP